MTKNSSKCKVQKVSVEEYAENYNPKLNRRGHKMSWSYIYRLIRKHIAGESVDLWFDYELDPDKKDRVWIKV